MPGMDGTGPGGQGSKTGRGLGPCGASGTSVPQATSTQPSSWLGRLLLGALGGLFSGSYGTGRSGGHGMGGGQGRGRGRS